jgi:sugar/nucleoside kinase (ribokinase family)
VALEVSAGASELIASVGDNCVDVSLRRGNGADPGAVSALVPASGPAPAELPGGNAFNVATVLAQDGRRVAYLGAVGEDAAADLILEAGVSAGVDMSRVISVPGPTGRTIVDRNAHGERHFVSEDYGAAAAYRLDDATVAWLSGARWLHFARQPDFAERAAALRARGAAISCDLG